MADEQEQIEAMRLMVGAAMKKMGDDLLGLHAKAKEATAEGGGLKKLDSTFESITKRLVGPVGVAAALYEVSKALNEVATTTVKLHAFANNTNLAVGQVEELQQGMRRMGMTTEEANASIATMTGKLNDLAAHKESSQFWQDLAKGGEGGVKLANAMKEMSTAGNNMGAITEFMRVFNQQDRTAKTTMAQTIGMTVDALENLEKRMKSNIPVMEESREAAQHYLDMWVDFEVRFENIWRKISGHSIEGINHLTEALHAEGIHASDVIGFIEREIDGDLEGIKNTVTEIKHIIDQVSAMKKWAESLDPGYNKAKEALQNNSVVGPAIKFLNTPASQMFSGVGGLFGKASGSVGDSGTTFSDRYGNWSGDMLNIERSSDKTLGEIRDSLLRIETGEGGKGGGGEGGMAGRETRSARDIPGGGRAMLGQRLGIGASRSGGGSAGITAPAGTPIQGEGMATVTAPDGKQFKVDEKFKDNFQGFIDDYYKEGGKFGPSTGTLGARPSNASGHPIGDAIDVNQIGRGIRSKTGITLPTDVEDKLAAKWGMVSGNQWTNNDQGHFGIRSQQAARDALIKNGVMPSEAENAVKGSWFNDRSTASGADASKVPGIALPGRSGLGKMHEITTPDGRTIRLPQIDVGPAKWTGRGVDFSAPAMKQLGFDPTDKSFSVRRADEDRDALDRSQNQSAGAFGKINASVEFLNVPNGVKTKADSDGDIFSQLQISRTKQAGVYGGTLGYE